jgi:hypothetical protein
LITHPWDINALRTSLVSRHSSVASEEFRAKRGREEMGVLQKQ